MGATIALLHDMADITTNIVKTLSESRDKTMIGFVFVSHMLIWFWTRLLVLPFLIVKIFFVDANFGNLIV